MKFCFKVVWTEWYLGLWWWPVKKDRTIGICIGPMHFIWTHNPYAVKDVFDAA